MPSVVIAPYSAEWPLRFAEVRAELLDAFGQLSVQIEHIGSTAVPGLAAKPVIDVLLGAESLAQVESKGERLAQLGYKYIAKYESEFPMRRYFVRPAAGSLRVNLHSVVFQSRFWQEHLAFRNALRASPSLVAQYQELKMQLAALFPRDRAAYTAAKAPFIQSVVASVEHVHNVG